jgi:hypothetical protein
MKPHLRLVVGNSCVNNPSAALQSDEALFNAYRTALGRWHSTKLETDRIAACNAYNAWASSFLGEQDSAAVKISPKQLCGFA